MATVQNIENARFLLKDALDSGDLNRVGIAVHAYPDTLSHQNFLGYKCKTNGKRGFAKLVPNIGHADFLHEPDTIHNEWRDTRLKNSLLEINNDDHFIDAAKPNFKDSPWYQFQLAVVAHRDLALRTVFPYFRRRVSTLDRFYQYLKG